MTTAAASARPGLIDTFMRLRLGPLVFVGVLAILDLLLIGPTQFVNGLTSGAIYALIALGYTMVYGIIELINFAHGDVFMVGVFASIFVLNEVLGQTGLEHRHRCRSCSSWRPPSRSRWRSSASWAWSSSASPTGRSGTRPVSRRS